MTLDLADVMQRATDGMPVETARLINGAYDRTADLRSSRRRRAASLGLGMVAVVTVVGLVVPAVRFQHVPGQDLDPYSSSPPASTLRLLPDDQLATRFTALLPGTVSDLVPQRFAGADDVSFEAQLTNELGRTGYVTGDFAVGDALPPDAVAENQRACRQMQRKVSPLDGTSCVLVQGGMIETWDDSVPPEDPAGDAPGVLLASVSLKQWDGATATLRALNTTASGIAPEPGAATVLSTDELVDLVQQVEWYAQK
jgi:hypothetical protein